MKLLSWNVNGLRAAVVSGGLKQLLDLLGADIICLQETKITRRKVSNMLLGKSGGLVLVAPERMKRLGQSRKDTQLQMYLVVKGESDAAKIYTP
ncbi:Exodeoxyribonuclease [Varanus komodoensis]|nr:Exodeoxyribonuclease [Varanus komodoensis]